jgi:PiT family inorganic phosphate transporter
VAAVTLVLILLAVVCLAYANGANDNFKGVATLFGSGTTDYRRALWWGTGATLLGSLTAVVLAGALLSNFSGKGLVDDALVSRADYGAAVALGAGLTVLLATRIGMPISTTHGLVGALVGAGWAAGSAINIEMLGTTFFLPLLVSPLLALVVTGVCYPLLHWSRRRLGISEQTCFCIGTETIEVLPHVDHALAVGRVEQLSLQYGTTVECRSHYAGRMLGLEAAVVLDRLHYLSAGAVSFARGLNDTPKIAALLLLAPALGGFGSTALVGVIMACGGLISARRVAETMSRKITPLNHGQGFTSNLITSVIVIGASRLGLPVSTTHVSCGSLFGIGTVTGKADWGTVGKILASWVTTLPLGAGLGAGTYWVISAL